MEGAVSATAAQIIQAQKDTAPTDEMERNQPTESIIQPDEVLFPLREVILPPGLEARECAFVLVPVPAGSAWLEGEKGKKVRQAAKSKVESEVRAGRVGKNRTDLELHQYDDSEIDIGRTSKFDIERAGGGGGRTKVKPDT